MVPEVRKNDNRYRFFINGCKNITFVSVFAFTLLFSSCAELQREEPVVEADKAFWSADPAMGDWQGGWKLDDGTESGPVVAQVIALGKGKYRAIFSEQFDTRMEPIASLDDRLEDAKASFTGKGNYDGIDLDIQAVIKGDKLSGSFKGEYPGTFELKKTVRLSPTLGAKPPDGAIVLFDGKNFRQWEHAEKKPGVDSVQWKLVRPNAMEVKRDTGSIVTKKKFTDFKLHLEFRTPFMPDKAGQGRGNSGVYLQGRYEVQILDSYGLEGKDNECGGIYNVGPPIVNMCAPPIQWQTYDITFYAPRFDSAGTKTQDAYVTVLHNGVTIHDERKIPKPTVASLDSNIAEPGGIYLQDHGNPVQFRNIWLVAL